MTTYALDVTSALQALINAQLPTYLTNLPMSTATTIAVNGMNNNTNPDSLLIQLDEYQPLQNRYQLVLKEGTRRSIYEAPHVYRIEQGIVLELHVRMVRFDPDATIPAQRLIFEQLQKAIQECLDANRYDTDYSLLEDVTEGSSGGVTTYASTIEMRGWSTEPMPHGFGRQKEPVEFVSRLGVTVIYYEVDDYPLTNVGDRVVSVGILGNTLKGLVSSEFEDIDPWVMIKIPKGPVIEQNLIGQHVDGMIVTKDWKSLATCLMQTQIQENPNHYPINSDNSKTMFSTTIPQYPEFVITMRDSQPQVSTSGTALIIFNFYNVRIKQIKLVKSSTQGGVMEPQWQILWMADYYYVGTLSESLAQQEVGTPP